MRQVIKILTYFMLLVLLTAEDCSNNSPSPSLDEQRLDLFQNIEDEFNTDKLTRKQLTAFEKRAEQKLIELFELLAIYSDTSLNTEFRQHVKESLDNMFVSNTDAETFLASQISLSPESVAISDSLQFVSTAQYAGLISYNYTFQQETLTGELPLLLEKTRKQFGDSSLEVWEVFFTVE
jgi:hypothetical protein